MRTTKRANFWELWTASIQKIANDVWDALTDEFAPFKFYDNGKLYSADKNTPEVRKLFDLLEKIREFSEAQNANAQQEVRDKENAEVFFDAWSLGLCPQAMRQYMAIPEYYCLEDVGDRRTWEEISEYKSTHDISRNDTVNAVETWHRVKQKAV